MKLTYFQPSGRWVGITEREDLNVENQIIHDSKLKEETDLLRTVKQNQENSLLHAEEDAEQKMFILLRSSFK